MNVLNVNISLDPVSGGGAAERTFQMSRYLARSGIGCTVLTLDTGLSSERISSIANVRVVALPCLLKRFYVPRFSFRQLRHIVAQADVIHLMNHWSLLNALIYWIARQLNKPYVVCPAGALPVYGRSKLIKHLYNWIIGKKILRDANACIAITPGELPQFQAYGVNLGNVFVIPNGISDEEFPPGDDMSFRRKHRLGDCPFVLFVGRLNHIKGPDLLLQAFCNLKDRFADLHLVFAGPDDGMRAQLKRAADDCGLAQRVHFIGYVGGMDKSLAYRASRLLAIPSRQEAMSIVVLEAGITATPVLLTDQCGFSQVAAIGGGEVVPATADGLQSGLSNMLKDSQRLKSMGENLRKYVNDNFLWESVVDKYLALYRDLGLSK
jgi:glycosyltransferase involved in cell wall biosynthesis